MVDVGGRLELFETKWTEVRAAADAVDLDFVRNVVGKSRTSGGAIICRTSNSFAIADGLRALPVTELVSTTLNGEQVAAACRIAALIWL